MRPRMGALAVFWAHALHRERYSVHHKQVAKWSTPPGADSSYFHDARTEEISNQNSNSAWELYILRTTDG